MRVRLKRAAIEAVIVRRNLTKTALARSVGLHRTHLSDLLAGRTAPGPRTRQRLLDVLGGTFDDYFEIVATRGRVSDAERVQFLLGRGSTTGEDEAAATRDRLSRMRDVLQVGLALAPEDRVWLDVEWKAAQGARRASRDARRSPRRAR
jgi:transcriptional regulator with XRE-family HTH domain